MLPRIGSEATRCFPFLFLLLALLVGTSRADQSDQNPPLKSMRTLILSDGGEHDWRSSSSILRKILEDSGRFEVRISESPVGLSSQTLSEFDVIIDNYAGPPLGGETEEAISRFVKAGKGLVVTHGALAASMGKSLTNDQLTRKSQDYWPLSAEACPDSPVRFLELTTSQSDHAILHSVPNKFRTADAIPSGIAKHPDAVVLATSTGDVPVLAVMNWGQGRVVGVALGHDDSAMHEQSFKDIFATACEWAATGTVAPQPDLDQQSTNSLRALLITGGHDHDAAFYTLFAGYEELASLPVSTSAAFQADLRDKYDVIIMYDFTRDLDDMGKKNLQAFVESGKGVVVLHHALLNYQKWSWWHEEAVGGSYRLDRSEDRPSSTYNDRQEIFASPASPHPITDGIAPFHITDEAYKHLAMSSHIRPLLTTDNPTSDPNLAWLGPREDFKVVAIQLGHGRSAFDHPAYQALVYNAILWAAGKTIQGTSK
jgi:type 1 glutamine amidotransferase